MWFALDYKGVLSQLFYSFTYVTYLLLLVLQHNIPWKYQYPEFILIKNGFTNTTAVSDKSPYNGVKELTNINLNSMYLLKEV